MFTLSHAVEVNPAGAEPVLAAEDVWRGLVMKAENALPFVPGMSRCDIIERGENWLLREVEFAGDTHRERISFRAPVQVHFERVGEGGFIENTISSSDHGPLLTFTFGLQFPGIEPGSPAERERGEGMKGAYIGAVAATLSRVREMKRNGEL
ncbi:MAG: DUF1857 family protein [Sphingomonas sp.]|uniref:SRPBCC family protein n=1 Tax=Sphingomonas sp. TaxID=28214 RepID=UPI0025CEF7AE|nr:SRPBCC family protein [Sphingomonas sp.]MBX3563576.1 DUF1857 family protein [Sphingomonas sp.]